MPQPLSPQVVTTEAHALEPVIHKKPLQWEEQALQQEKDRAQQLGPSLAKNNNKTNAIKEMQTSLAWLKLVLKKSKEQKKQEFNYYGKLK